MLVVGCSKKTDNNPTVKETVKISTVKPIQKLTLEEYLALPVWKTEKEAFSLLSLAVNAKKDTEMKNTYSRAVQAFTKVRNTLQDLSVADAVTSMNTLQIDMSTLYIDSLKAFIKSGNPDDLLNLKIADTKMSEFISALKRVQD